MGSAVIRSTPVYPGDLSFWVVGLVFGNPIASMMYSPFYCDGCDITNSSSNEAISANVTRRIAQCSKKQVCTLDSLAAANVNHGG